MNIKFHYLYRDGANFKQFKEVVFSNPNEIKLRKIETIIKDHLIDECWFVAKDWSLPDLHFKEYNWDNEIDHDWHEFESVEGTDEKATEAYTIDEFLADIRLGNSYKL